MNENEYKRITILLTDFLDIPLYNVCPRCNNDTPLNETYIEYWCTKCGFVVKPKLFGIRSKDESKL